MKFDTTHHQAIVRLPHGGLQRQLVRTPRVTSQTLMVKMSVAGVCGTDLQILRGLRPDSATILGHEGMGVVLELGGKVKNFHKGDLVSFLPHSFEQQDRILGHNVDGLWQEKRLMLEEDLTAGLLVKLPYEIPKALGALLEPLAAVIYSYSLICSKLIPKTVAIFGAGQIGLLYAIYLRLANSATKIYLVHNSLSHLQWAIRQNIITDDCGLLFDENIVNKLLRMSAGGVDASIICVNRDAAAVVTQAVQASHNGSCIDLISGTNVEHLNKVRRNNVCGCPQPGCFICHKFGAKEVFVTGHRGVASGHIIAANRMLKEHGHHFLPLVSSPVDIDTAVALLNYFRRTGKKAANWIKLAIML